MTAEKRGDRPRIRIALLDTGICDEGSGLDPLVNEVIKYRQRQGFPDNDLHPIKKRKSFVEGDKSCVDTTSCGHGTQIACLLLKYAPDADLYVARVSASMAFAVTDGVVNAMKWAAGKYVQADIITMSFGVEELNVRLEKALQHVLGQLGKAGHTPLVFASASNTGLAKKRRSYPASDSRVICAYALDGLGNDSSGLNPPLAENDFNFGTLGHGVDVKWEGQKGSASGTSYAAPILAAITANYLDWLSYHDAALDPKKRYLWKKTYIEKLFKEHMGVEKHRMIFVHPETFFAFGGHGVPDNYAVNKVIQEADKETDVDCLRKLNSWLRVIGD